MRDKHQSLRWFIRAGVLALGLLLILWLDGNNSEDQLKQATTTENNAHTTATLAHPERTVIEGDAFQVQVIDAHTKEPLPDATLTTVNGSQKLFYAVRTDQEGKATAPHYKALAVFVDAPGFCTYLDLSRPAVDDALIVELFRKGDLRLSFQDSFGEPVKGIQVGLLPPGTWSGSYIGHVQSLSWDAETLRLLDTLRANLKVPITDSFASTLRAFVGKRYPSRANRFREENLPELHAPFGNRYFPRPLVKISNEQGEIRWEGLPSVQGYRWCVISDHKLKLNPPYEVPEVEQVGEGWKFNSLAGRTLSGPFDVHEVRETYFQSEVVSLCTVAGVFQAPQAASVGDGFARVFKLRPRGNVIDAENEVHQYTEPNGSFVFEGIEPGYKRVSGYWLDQRGGVWFYRTVFDLEAGETKNLGVIHAQEGGEVDVEIVFMERDQEIPRDLLYDAETPTYAYLDVSTTRKGREYLQEISERVLVPVDGRYRLHSMTPGHFSLSLRGLDDFKSPWPKSKPPFEVPDFGLYPRGLVFPLPESLRFEIPVYRPQRVDVRVIVPEDAPCNYVTLQLAPFDDRNRWAKDSISFGKGSADPWVFYPPNDPEQKPVTIREGNKLLFSRLSVDSGQYILLATGYESSKGEKRPFLVAYQAVQVNDGYNGTFLLELKQGASLQGRMETLEGEPVVGRSIGLNFIENYRPEKRGNTSGETYYATTKEDGTFTFGGLPPNTRLAVTWLRQKEPHFIQTGGPGSVVHTTVIFEKK